MSDYTSWHAGMRVECVEPDSPQQQPGNPLFGCVYTVTSIFTCSEDGEVLVDLRETPAIEDENYWGGYPARYFRPVQTRKTSIAIFERIRDNPKAPITSPKQRERV